MKNETPTPRTDAVTRTFRDPCGEVIGNKIVSADFAQQLERELNEANEQLTIANRRIAEYQPYADSALWMDTTNSPTSKKGKRSET